MDSEALVKLALLDSRRASGDLIRIVGFGAQLLCASLHVLHRPLPWLFHKSKGPAPFHSIESVDDLISIEDRDEPVHRMRSV
jgi:hypothetical protein